MELIFVYNAESGIFSMIKDALHKTILPSTYQCNLCALTYGTIAMKDEWKTFIDNLQISSLFLHRDEFIQQLETHPHNLKEVKFPAIFLNKLNQIGLLVNHHEINACQTLTELMDLITQKL
jgi:hypothetical protein